VKEEDIIDQLDGKRLANSTPKAVNDACSHETLICSSLGGTDQAAHKLKGGCVRADSKQWLVERRTNAIDNKVTGRRPIFRYSGTRKREPLAVSQL
jgi:hypothetical protein